METCKGFGRLARGLLATLTVFLLTGCWETFKLPSDVKTKSETEIAVSAVKDEWLKRCDGLEGDMPANGTGNLLKDYADATAALAVCIARHNDLAGYLEPVVKKERGN